MNLALYYLIELAVELAKYLHKIALKRSIYFKEIKIILIYDFTVV